MLGSDCELRLTAKRRKRIQAAPVIPYASV